jgi:hypothetical protein
VRVAISVLVTIFVEVVKIVRRIVAVVVVISVAVVVIVVGMVVVVVAVVVIVAVLVSVTVVVVVVAKVIALGHSLKYITSSPCGLLNTIEGVIELTVGVIWLVMSWGVRVLTVGVTVDGVYVSAAAVAGYDRRLVVSPPLVNPVVIIQSFWVEAANPCCKVPGWCNATEKERSPTI